MARRGATLLSVAGFLALGFSDAVPEVFAEDSKSPPVQTTIWNPVGGSNAINDDVWALNANNNDVLVGGDFYNVSGIATADDLVRWNGTTWSGVGDDGGSNGAFHTAPSVRAIARDGQDMYVGGTFTDAFGNTDGDRIAFWDHVTGDWSALDTGLNGTVNAIVVDSSGNAYVGGEFTNAGGIAEADYVAMWDGSSWSALGQTGTPSNGALADRVNALVLKNGTLFAGGLFTNADGDTEADYIAKWTGSAWDNLGNNGANVGALGGQVYAMLVSGSDIIVGGNFTNAGGVAAADRIAKWSASTWQAIGPATFNNDVYALAKSSNGDIYAGGLFTDSGGAMDYIARYDGSSWSALGNNGSGNGALNNTVHALAIFDNEIYAGGFFTNAGGNANADYLANFALPPALKADARVRVGSSAGYTGNNVYSTTGTNQKVTKSAKRNHTMTFELSIQNDSLTDSDDFKVTASGALTADFDVVYFDGATDVTTLVDGVGWSTGLLAPGATQTLTIEVTVVGGPSGGKVTRTLTVTSNGDPTKQDAVKVVGKRK